MSNKRVTTVTEYAVGYFGLFLIGLIGAAADAVGAIEDWMHRRKESKRTGVVQTADRSVEIR